MESRAKGEAGELNPVGVRDLFIGLLTQGGAAAPLTLGFGVEPLRG